MDLSDIITAGETYSITWRRKSTYTAGPFADLIIEESTDLTNWTENATRPSTDQQTFITTNITAGVTTRYLRIRPETASSDDSDIDAISYSSVLCGVAGGGGTPTGNFTCSAGVTEITGTVFEDFNYVVYMILENIWA